MYFLPVFFSVHKCKLFTKQRPSSILLLFLCTNRSETVYISLKYFWDDYLKWHHKIFKCVFTIIIWWKGKERWSLSFCENQNSAVWPIRYPFPLVPAKRKETTTASSFCQKGKWPFHWGCSASWAAQQAAGRSRVWRCPLKDLSFFYTAVHRTGALGLRRNLD